MCPIPWGRTRPGHPLRESLDPDLQILSPTLWIQWCQSSSLPFFPRPLRSPPWCLAWCQPWFSGWPPHHPTSHPSRHPSPYTKPLSRFNPQYLSQAPPGSLASGLRPRQSCKLPVQLNPPPRLLRMSFFLRFAQTKMVGILTLRSPHLRFTLPQMPT